ncbi:MAG: XRE family transcriptional regulator [Oscillospiraceae bacterium]|nr:XRE family transcriptional regulator [Oscillospiraceae bacterium]MCL2279062.1 XRE family transcriptional regulator [Oscillospiraceae bacterium]
MSYGAILAKLRKEKGYTQSDVANHISRVYGKPCSFKVVSHWENGVSSPSVEQFLLLCEYYGIADIQGTFRRTIKLYDIPVAAGAGVFLDSEHFTMLDVDETIPSDADFAVRVSGDSMEPRFVDCQVIFIKKQKTLEVGEIGIFALNGDSFVKKLGHGKLVSLNSRYEPIEIKEEDSLYVLGKVVG